MLTQMQTTLGVFGQTCVVQSLPELAAEAAAALSSPEAAAAAAAEPPSW